MPFVRGQSCHYAVFDICRAGEWNYERSFDWIVSFGDVPESGVLREKLSARHSVIEMWRGHEKAAWQAAAG
jgi:hypothetical protein